MNLPATLKKLLPFAALPLLLAVLVLLLTDTPSMPSREVHGENGVWDLRGFDFENYTAILTGELAYIPNALLTPEEFAARSGEIVTGNVGDTVDVNFLTSRDIILLPGEGWFTFTRSSITYAQRQYVNGEWLSNTGRGRPGQSRETNIPDTGWITFTAQPQDGAIELVQQSSNFVHRQGNRHWAWQISSGTGLVYQSRAGDFRQGIVMGSFFLLFLLFALLYFMMQRNRAVLYFALFCLMWFLRVGITGTRAFTVLAPWLSWDMKFRIEYFSIPVAAILTLAIIDALFPKVLNKAAIRVLYIISAAFIALYALADTVFISRAGLVAYVIFGVAILYVLGSFVCKVRGVNLGQGIFIGGMVVFLFAAISDIILFSFYNIGVHILPFEATGMAVLIFALCEAAAVFIATMREVESARAKERELLRMTDFYRRMAHELLTPLTRVSVGIQESLHFPEEAAENLREAQAEIMSMSEKINRALDDSEGGGATDEDNPVR